MSAPKSLVALLALLVFACGAPDDAPNLGSAAKADDGIVASLDFIDADKALSDADWQALTFEEKERLLEAIESIDEGEWQGMKTIAFHKKASVGRPVDIDRIYYAPYRQYATLIDAYARSEMYMDVMDMDGTHSTIGDPGIKWFTILVRTADYKVMGAQMEYVQEGCDMPAFEDDVRAFPTEEAALEAGCDLSDVSWSGRAFFGPATELEDGSLAANPFMVDYYLEWSGY